MFINLKKKNSILISTCTNVSGTGTGSGHACGVPVSSINTYYERNVHVREESEPPQNLSHSLFQDQSFHRRVDAGALGVFVLARKRQENMSLPLHMELILSTETKKEFTWSLRMGPFLHICSIIRIIRLPTIPGMEWNQVDKRLIIIINNNFLNEWMSKYLVSDKLFPCVSSSSTVDHFMILSYLFEQIVMHVSSCVCLPFAFLAFWITVTC